MVPKGKAGAALALANPVYLAITDEETLRRVTSTGVPGTSMPAFARQAAATLTDDQIDVLVREIRSRWSRPDALGGVTPPAYRADAAGEPVRGEEIFRTFCASCHGPDGKGGPKGSSIVDGSYLALVSDQGLRTTVIAGRPDLGQPDWRSYVAGRSPVESGRLRRRRLARLAAAAISGPALSGDNGATIPERRQGENRWRGRDSMQGRTRHISRRARCLAASCS